MDLGLTEEQQMVRELAARLAREKIAPSAAEHDSNASYPTENIRLLAESGLVGIEVPTELGGAGMDAVASVLAISEIAANTGTVGWQTLITWQLPYCFCR